MQTEQKLNIYWNLLLYLFNQVKIIMENEIEIMVADESHEKYVDVIRKRWAEFTHGEGCDWEALTPAINEKENINF